MSNDSGRTRPRVLGRKILRLPLTLAAVVGLMALGMPSAHAARTVDVTSSPVSPEPAGTTYTVKATVEDDGTPVPGIQVKWKATKIGPSSPTLGAKTSTTNASGEATTTITSSVEGSSTVEATAFFETPPGPGRQTGEITLVWGAGNGEAPTCPPLTGGFFAFDKGFTGGVYVATGDINGDGCDDIIVGAGEGGGPHVKVFQGDGTLITSFFPYATGFTGGVRVSAEDIDGDSLIELVTAPGPGGGPHVRVFDFNGTSFVPKYGFMAYDPGFTGGVYVGTGFFADAPAADIVTGAGQGGGPHVRVFDGTTGTGYSSFFAFAPSFTGGVRVEDAQVDGDGLDELVTAAGPGGGPHVKIFDSPSPFTLMSSFFAYPSGFTGGVYLGGGDLTVNINDELATGAGPGGGPHVRIFAGETPTVLGSFMAYATGFTGGVRLAAGDADGDGDGEVITGPGPGGGPHVKIFE